MCNRYRMTAKQAELAERYSVEPIYPEDVAIPPPKLFPQRPAWVVRQADGTRTLDTMVWGPPRKVPGKKVDKITGKPVLLDTKVTNVRNYTSLFWSDVPSRLIVSLAGVWRPTDTGAVFASLTTEPNPLVGAMLTGCPSCWTRRTRSAGSPARSTRRLRTRDRTPSQLMSVRQAENPRAVIGED